MATKLRPIQRRILRAVKRYQFGFVPTVVGGKIVRAGHTSIRFQVVPEQLIQIEIADFKGNASNELFELRERGFVERFTRNMRCQWAPMMLQTEDGATLRVADDAFNDVFMHRGKQLYRKRHFGAADSYRITPGGLAVLDNADASQSRRRVTRKRRGKASALTPKQSALVELHEVQRMSLPDIAKAWRVKLQSVHQLYNRTKENPAYKQRSVGRGKTASLHSNIQPKGASSKADN